MPGYQGVVAGVVGVAEGEFGVDRFADARGRLNGLLVVGALHLQAGGPPAAREEVVEDGDVLEAGAQHGHHRPFVDVEALAGEVGGGEVVLEGVIVGVALQDVGVGHHNVALFAFQDAGLAHDVDAGHGHAVDTAVRGVVVGAQEFVHRLVGLFAEGVVHHQQHGGVAFLGGRLEVEFGGDLLGVKPGRVEDLYAEVGAGAVGDLDHPVLAGHVEHQGAQVFVLGLAHGAGVLEQPFVLAQFGAEGGGAEQAVGYAVEVGADDVQRAFQQAVFQQYGLHVQRPALPEVVVAGVFAQAVAEGDLAVLVVVLLAAGQLPQPVGEVEEGVEVVLTGEAAAGGHHLLVGAAQQGGEVGVGGLQLDLLAGLLLLHHLAQQVPLALGAALAVAAVAADLVGLGVEEGQVGEDVVDVGAAARHLDVHLVGVDAVGAAAAGGGNDGFEIGILVALAGDQLHVAALLDALRQAVHHVVEAVELHGFLLGDAAVYLRAQEHQVVHQRLTAQPAGLVAAADQQVTHGDVEPLDGGAGLLGAGAGGHTFGIVVGGRQFGAGDGCRFAPIRLLSFCGRGRGCRPAGPKAEQSGGAFRSSERTTADRLIRLIALVNQSNQ